MNASVVNIAVVDGKTITQTVELSSVINGQPVRIKAVQGGKYILAEGANGVAPENITIKRVGKDLHIALEGSDPDQPQLIIEDFEGSGGQLVGVAEDGSYHEYISSDAEQDRSAAFLIEGVEAPQVLGAQPLAGFGNGLAAGAGIGWFWPALLGLAALGVLGGVYAATRGGDSGNDDDKGIGDGDGNADKGSVGGADDNVGDKQGLIENGGSTDDRTPTFTGDGRPGTSVEIIDNGKTIGTAIVGEDGKWEYTPPEPGLDDGKHDIVIVPIDENGDKGEPSPGYEIIVDTVAPSRPLIDGIYDDLAPQEGLIGSGGHTNDTTPTLSGTGEADAIIHIYDNGVEIGSVLADADGKWNFTPDPALSEGSHEFTVAAEDAAGNISTPSLPFPIIVDITVPDKPGAGTGGIEDVQDNVGPIQGSIGNGDSTDDTTPTLTGNGLQPGDVVMIYDNGQMIGSTPVMGDGSWSFTPTTPLNDGAHPFTVVAVDSAGNASVPSEPWTIDIDTTAPIASAVVDSMGKDSGADDSDFLTNDGSAGRLIQGSLTAALGAGESVQISTDGGTTWFDVLLNADNTWNFIDQNSHTDDWTIQTRVVDAAANINAASQDVILDRLAPDAPVTIEMSGNVVTVTFGGDAEPGDTVKVIFGDHAIDYELSAADVAAGTADIDVPQSIIDAQPESFIVSAAIIDAQGNSSDYRWVSTESVLENFETDADQALLNVGDTADSGMFLLTQVSAATDSSSPSGITSSVNGTNGTVLAVSGTTNLSLKGLESTSLTFSWAHSQTTSHLIIFYDAMGNEVDRRSFGRGDADSHGNGTSTFIMPSGATFSSFDITPGVVAELGMRDWIHIDNIRLSGLSDSNGINPPPIEQTVIVGADSYQGGDDNNSFNLGDVSYFNESNAKISGGAGTDTLALTGQDQVLNLSTITGKLESIEIIDITGTGANTLNLSVGDVLEQGETSLFTDDEVMQMMIKGNAGDVVNLDDLLPDGTAPGDWATAGIATIAGVTYNVFQHSTLDAQLLVQDGVTTNLV